MNSFCRNCGEKLETNVKYCAKCGAEVFSKRINIEEEKQKRIKFKRKENIFIALIISLIFFTFLLSRIKNNFFVSFLNPLFFLIAIILLVYAKIKLKKSKKIKILFDCFVSLVISFLLINILLEITCSNAINTGVK